jgi:hypothetical protein
MYREWKKIEFPRVLSMKLEATRLRGRPRNRWQDEVSEDGRVVGREKYTIGKNGRSSLERQEITAFCTWQCNE